MPTPKFIDSKQVIADWSVKKQNFWIRQQKENIKKLFLEIIKSIPNYRDFLVRKKYKFPKKFDSSEVPQVNKKDFFKKYSLQSILPKEQLKKKGFVLTSTSGSTSEPTYFLRDELVDYHYSIIAENFLNNGKKGSTLLINCFGMGVWIGGLITYQAFRMASLRGNPVTIITPGINKKEIFNALQKLAPMFDNVILSGYPPFIKDIVDESELMGIDLKKIPIRLVFAAESFTEKFRDYLVEKCGIQSAYYDTMNIYGSAELGAMAFENPGTILIRKLILNNADLHDSFFEDKKIPTLVQYDPRFTNFEIKQKRILISGHSSTNLIRYDIGDNGGVYQYEEVISKFKELGVDLIKEANRLGIKLFELPFVYIYERADFSTTIYGLQVYPQTIKQALENKIFFSQITGKFNLLTKYNKRHDQYLEVNIELIKGKKSNKALKTKLEQYVIKALLDASSEFRELTKMIGVKRVKPKVILWENGHRKYFQSGVKQKWVSK